MNQSVLLHAKNYTVTPVVHMVQGDTSRNLICQLEDLTPEAGSSATLWATRPDETVYCKVGTISGQNVTVPFDVAGGFLSQAGTVKAQLVITDANSKVVSTFDFDVIVHETRGGTATTDDVEWRDQLAADLEAEIATKVPMEREINGKALDEDITLYGTDIELSSSDSRTIGNVAGLSYTVVSQW